jgi:hypothetical protein
MYTVEDGGIGARLLQGQIYDLTSQVYGRAKGTSERKKAESTVMKLF